MLRFITENILYFLLLLYYILYYYYIQKLLYQSSISLLYYIIYILVNKLQIFIDYNYHQLYNIILYLCMKNIQLCPENFCNKILCNKLNISIY